MTLRDFLTYRGVHLALTPAEELLPVALQHRNSSPR